MGYYSTAEEAAQEDEGRKKRRNALSEGRILSRTSMSDGRAIWLTYAFFDEDSVVEIDNFVVEIQICGNPDFFFLNARSCIL